MISLIQTIILKFFLFISKIFFPSYCYICNDEGETICTRCLHTIEKTVDVPFPYITTIYSFKNKNIKKIIHSIKYFHRKDLIPPLTSQLVTVIKMRDLSTYILVPIPMPLLRKYIRGYNHTEAIADSISKQTSLPVRKDILTRNVSKKRQVMTTSRRERLSNQRGAFTVVNDITGLNIILIDDVTTTGATLSEARKKLLEKGALHVEAFTIAH